MNETSGAVVVVSPAELAALVEAAVRRALADRPPSDASAAWLGPDEVAALTGYTRRYIPELVRLHGLPCSWAGRKMRFRRSEVERWMEARRHG